MKIIKSLLLILIIGLILTIAFVFYSVRFQGIRITDKGSNKTILGYNSQKGRFVINEYITLDLAGPDGPYLNLTNNTIQQVLVHSSENISQIVKQKASVKQTFTCEVDNTDKDSFTFTLHDTLHPFPPPDIFEEPEKIAVISDIEGNFNTLYSLLVSNGVMDSSFHWTFQNNHLVILGDAVDRGNNVIQCLWLIYHLEKLARKQGGYVHYILGNHEVLNLNNDIRYVNDKYIALAQQLSGSQDFKKSYQFLLTYNNILIDWIKSRNCIEKIGNSLFTHGGISPQVLQKQLSIHQINERIRQQLTHASSGDEINQLLMGKQGPLWYRNLVMDFNGEPKVAETFVNQLLTFYQVKRLIVGHTIVNHVSTDYHEKLVRVDINHQKDKFSIQSEALLIKKNMLYRLDGKGGITKLTSKK